MWMYRLIAVAPLVAAMSASGHEFDQVWACELQPGKTLAEARAATLAWKNAARSMPGGEKLEVYIRYPIIADPSSERFDFVLRAPSLEAWGRFYDAYDDDSAVAAADAEFADIAECTGSSLWEIIGAGD